MKSAKTFPRLKPNQHVEAVERFRQFIPLAHRIAGIMHLRYGIPSDELHDEAESILGRIAVEWVDPDSTGCKAMTLVYRQLRWRLTEYCTRKQPKYFTFSSIKKQDGSTQLLQIGSPPTFLENLLKVLSVDAKVVVQTILFAPGEIVEDVLENTSAQSVIRNFIEDYHGWSQERLAKAWNEIEVAL